MSTQETTTNYRRAKHSNTMMITIPFVPLTKVSIATITPSPIRHAYLFNVQSSNVALFPVS